MTMQKLLGGNYKWWILFSYEFKIQTIYLIDNIAWVLGQILLILPIIWIWQINNPSDLDQLITYFIIGNIGLSLIENTLSYRVAYEIGSGKIVRFLLLPNSYLKMLFFRGIGRNSVANLSAASVLIFISFFYRSNLVFTSWINLCLWFLVLVLGYIIKTWLEILIGFLSFWFVEIENFIFFFRHLFLFLSGSLIPFYYLGAYSDFLQANTLAFTFYHPMQIYLGKYDSNQTILVFLGGLSWCAALYILAKIVFKLGLKKNESVGL